MIRVVNLVTHLGKLKRIDRNTILGNPFVISKEGGKHTRTEAVSKYAEYFLSKMAADQDFQMEIAEIYKMHREGKTVNLGCWCAPLPCHGDVIKRFCYAMEAIEKLLCENRNLWI